MVVNLRDGAPSSSVGALAGDVNGEAGKPSPADNPHDGSLPISSTTAIVVIDRRVLMRECLVRCLRATIENSIVHAFAGVAQWLQVAAKHPPAGVIVLCSHGDQHANSQTERDLQLLSRSGLGVPAVILADSEGAEHVVAALKSGVRGYIPTSVTLDVAIQAMRLVEAGGTCVPASSLIPSRVTGNSVTPQRRSFDGLFTKRQSAVVEALRHGKANKTIAYELNMREGTVKAHVRTIMKKLNARNRTEVAVLTSGLLGGAG